MVSFLSLPLAVSFAFRFSPCSWRAVALCSQSTTTLCKQACSHCYASSAHLFLFFSSSRSFHSHSASLHAHDALSRYAAKAQLCFASQLARTVMLRLRTFFFSFSFPRGFHSHSASLHAHGALSRYAAKAQLRFASKLARAVMLRLRTACKDLQIVSYIGLHRSRSGLTVCYDFLVL